MPELELPEIVALLVGAGAAALAWQRITASLRETVRHRTKVDLYMENHDEVHKDVKKEFSEVKGMLAEVISNQNKHSRHCERHHQETGERLVRLETLIKNGQQEHGDRRS